MNRLSQIMPPPLPVACFDLGQSMPWQEKSLADAAASTKAMRPPSTFLVAAIWSIRREAVKRRPEMASTPVEQAHAGEMAAQPGGIGHGAEPEARREIEGHDLADRPRASPWSRSSP